MLANSHSYMSYNTTPSESTVRAVRSARTVSKTVTVREPVTTYVERQVKQPVVEPTIILTLHLTELDALEARYRASYGPRY